MCLFSIKILKTYCPNLTSTPPCPASMTMVYCAFGELVALTAKQAPTTEQIKITPAKITHNVRLFIVKNFILYFIRQYDYI